MAKFKIKHETTDDPEGPGQKRWHVYIDGDLDKIRSVEYKLPPSFPRPEVKGRDRQNKFSIDASGFSGAVIQAQIEVEGRTTPVVVSHTLSPESSDTEGTDVDTAAM